MQIKRTLILFGVLILLLTTIVHCEVVSRVYYVLIYNPVENTGILVVNATMSLPNCDYIVIPVNIFGEESELTLLNYTAIGDLVISGVEYSEESGDLVVFACNSGEISVLFTATNIFSESGFGAYVNSVDTTPLRELRSAVTVEMGITGSYNISIIPVGVSYSVESTVESTSITIYGIGQAYIVLYSVIEIPETPMTTPTTPTLIPTPTPTPSPTPTPPLTPTKIPDQTLLGILVTVVVVILIVLLIKKKRT